MPLTKEQIAELAKADKVPELFTKDEFQAEVESVLTKRLAKEKAKQEASEKKLHDFETAHAALQAKLEAMATEGDTKGKSELEKYQADLARERKAREALEKEKAVSLAALQAAHAAQLEFFREQKLRALLLKNGADPNQLDDIALVASDRLRDAIKVEEDNGAIKIKAINPLTLEAKEADDVVKGFLATRPSFQRARPGGGGAPQARGDNITPPKPWTEGKNDPAQWGEAMKEFVTTHPTREAQKDRALLNLKKEGDGV